MVLTVEQRARLAAVLDRTAFGAAVALGIVQPLSLSLTELALVVGVVAWIAKKALARERFAWDPVVTGILLAWAASITLSMGNTPDLWGSMHGLRKFVKHAALYYWLADIVSTNARLRRALAGVLVGLGIMLVDSVWQRLTGWDLFYHRPLQLLLDSAPRIIATYHHANDLATYLTSVFPLVVVLSLSGPARRRLAGLGVALAMMVIMVLTFSRPGVLAFACALIFLGLVLKHWKPWALCALLALGAVLATPAVARTWAKQQASLLDILTEPERQMYWRTARNMIAAHPIVGIGSNTFTQQYPRYRGPDDQFAEAGPYAHNQYLHMAAEQGVVGLGIFAAFLIVIFGLRRRLSPARVRTSFPSLMVDGLQAALVGYLVLGCLESSLFYARAGTMFWWIVGLLTAAWQLARIRGPTRP